jgi:hypothetical protein
MQRTRLVNEYERAHEAPRNPQASTSAEGWEAYEKLKQREVQKAARLRMLRLGSVSFAQK